MLFDTNAVKREVQVVYLIRHRSSARNLSPLASALRHFTDSIGGERARHGADGADAEWDAELAQWRQRLGAYEAALASVRPNDLEGIVWTVTAPLLLGLFGGPGASAATGIPDFLTPFVLANGLDVPEKFQREAWSRFKTDKAGPGGLLRKVAQVAMGR